MAKKQRAALLARVSTPQQIKIGLESQVAVLKKRAIKDGYEVPDSLIFQEQITGLDAKKEIRKSLQDLMDAVEEHKVDVCYTYELTRISRDPFNLVERVKWFTDRKIPLYIYDAEMWTLDRATKEEIEETTSYVFGAATYGKIEAKKMKERTKRGRNEVAEEGLYVGHLSDGYCVVQTERGKEIKIDEDRRPVIERIFNMYEEGYTTDRIAEVLNMDGVSTASRYRLHSSKFKGYQDTYHKKATDIPISRDETKWQGSVVGAYLKNKWYIGERKYNKQQYSIDPIITKEQWSIVSAMLKENSISFRSKRESRKHIYLLSRLLFCGNCGNRLYGHYTGLNNHYYCSTVDEGRKCGLRGINKENIEAIVTLGIKVRGIFDMFNGVASPIENFFNISPKEEKKLKDEIKNNNLEIDDIDKKIEKNKNNYNEAIRQSILYAGNKDRQLAYEKIIRDFEKEKSELTSKRERLVQQNILHNKRLNAKSNIAHAINRVIEERNLVTLRELFLTVIDKVYLYNLTPSIDVIRVTFADGWTEDYVYAYRLMQQNVIFLYRAFNISNLIYYDVDENLLKCKGGKGILIGKNFKPYEDYLNMSSSEIEQLGQEGVDYLVLKDEVVPLKEFVKYCSKNLSGIAYAFERLEELTDEAKEQDAKYKVWRKKYNTGLPTSIPYLVKDENYETIAKRRKYLYNRKLKVKKHKSLSEEEKQKQMEAIEKELALLKAKLKYLDREEAVKVYKKNKEVQERDSK